MKKNNAFALLEVLLAVILIVIVTVGSYALVKNVRSSSGIQKLTRYSINIAENYKPFLNSSVSTGVLSGKETLSRDFLKSIYIPDSDLACTGTGSDSYCAVYFDLPGKYTSNNYMKFRVVTDHTTDTNFFVIDIYDAVPVRQKDQMLQSLGSVFSLYCLEKNSAKKNCQLGGEAYSYVSIVYPKAGSSIPS